MTRLIVWALKTFGNRQFLESVVFEALEAPPIRGIIEQDENRRLMLSGKVLAPEQLMQLQESARNALDSYALKVIRDQIRFRAINDGFLSNQDPTETASFWKAALWYAQEEKNLLQSIAG